MLLFLDANILFTAVISPEGKARTLIRLAQGNICRLASSGFTTEEAQRNLGRKYPKNLDDFSIVLRHVQRVPEPSARLEAWARDYLPLKDAPVLAAAVACKADLLVTGDKRHFGRFYGQTLEGVTIVSLSEALERVLSGD